MAINANQDGTKNRAALSKALDNEHELKKEKALRGFLGEIWGSTNSVPNNIAALGFCTTLLFAITYSLLYADNPSKSLTFSIKEMWGALTPLMTLFVGYLFGTIEKKKEQSP